MYVSGAEEQFCGVSDGESSYAVASSAMTSVPPPAGSPRRGLPSVAPGGSPSKQITVGHLELQLKGYCSFLA